MPTINIEFEALGHDQQEKVRAAYGSRNEETERVHECSGCVVYLGATPAGEHTYFCHYGQSEWGLVVPEADENPHMDYASGTVWIAGKEFDGNGEEVLPPPFHYLVHFDIRKWSGAYRASAPFASEQEEIAFLTCCGGNPFSIPPERAAKKLGVPSGTSVSWVGHFYLKPEELSDILRKAAVALTIVKPNGDRIVVM